jgi:hypothetical protein
MQKVWVGVASAGTETIPGMPALLDSELEETVMNRHALPFGILLLLLLIGTASGANILLNSSQFNATVWTKHNTNTLMVNDTTDTTDPLGTNTADRIRFLGASGDNYYIAQPAYVVSGQSYNFKFDVKPYSSAFYIIQLTGGSTGFGTGQWANYNASSCTVAYSTGGTATAVSNGSGWCTIGLTVPAIITGSVTSPALFATNNDTAATRAPTYTTAASTYMYVWGGSMENVSGTDTTPPASITGLTNSSTSSTAIMFSWTNPASDFDHVMVWMNGTFLHNVTTPYDYWGSLEPTTDYTISTKTVDAAGNVNATFVNLTARTTGTATFTSIFNTTNSSDGSVGAYNVTGAPYQTLRDTGGMMSYKTDASGKGTRLIGNQTGITGYEIDRGVFGFDTSGIPDDAVIIGANFSVVATGASNQMSQLGTATYAITKYTPNTPGDIVYQYDYSNLTTQTFSATNLTPTASARNVWPFSASGLTLINKVGWTGIMMRQVPWDIDNVTTGITWVDGATRNRTQFDYYMSEAGGENVPRLIVWYTSSGSETVVPVSGASFTPANVTHRTVYGNASETFTANAPLSGTLSYVWTYKNVTGDNIARTFSTVINPTHTFTPGNYSIVVNISNSTHFSITPENTNWLNHTQWSQDGTDLLPLLPSNHILRQNISNPATFPTKAQSSTWTTSLASGGGYFKLYQGTTATGQGKKIMYVGNGVNMTSVLFDRVLTQSDLTGIYAWPEDVWWDTASGDGNMYTYNRDTRIGNEFSYVNDASHPNGTMANGSHMAGTGNIYDYSNLTIHRPVGTSAGSVSGLQRIPLLLSYADMASPNPIGHAIEGSYGTVDAASTSDVTWPASATTTADGANANWPKMGERARLNTACVGTTAMSHLQTAHPDAYKISLGLRDYGLILAIRSGAGMRINSEVGLISDADNTALQTSIPLSCFEFVDESSLMVSSNSYAVNAVVAPTAAFHANITSSSTGTSVPAHFYDDSAAIGATYLWAYKESADPSWTFFSSDQNPVYTFIPGTYSINQTVTNTAGTDSEIKTNYLTFTTGEAPVSHFYMNLTTTSPAAVYGAESFNTTGLTIGGGAGYSDLVTSGDYTVTTVANLQTALASATSGDVVYISPSTTLNLSGYSALTIPSGVTLASNRGSGGSSGALIIKKTGGGTWGWEQPMFKTTGVDVRVTGLRLEGEMLAQDGTVSGGEARFLVGLEAEGATNFEVDNCELRGWSWSAVSLDRSSNSYVHNNYIHHNQAAGEGYGTSLYEGTAIIERNLYSYNRHDITGDGNGNEQYIFRYNIDLGTGSASGGSRTDVHEGTGGYAGSTFNISYNTFKASGSNQLLLPIQVSEKPLVDMTISHNIFEGSTIMGGGYYTAPVRQLVDATFGNLTVSDNYWNNILYPTDTSVVMYEVR